MAMASATYVLGTIDSADTFYERGLLHPFLDYAQLQPWLNELVDPMDHEGFVRISPKPGLRMAINFDYIQANPCK